MPKSYCEFSPSKDLEACHALRSAHTKGLVAGTCCRDLSPVEFTRQDHVAGTSPLKCLHEGTSCFVKHRSLGRFSVKKRRRKRSVPK